MFQVSEANFSELQNKLWLHKHVPPSQYGHLPFYEFQNLVQAWLDEIKEQEAQRKKQEAEQAKAQGKAPKAPKAPKTPKMPRR